MPAIIAEIAVREHKAIAIIQKVRILTSPTRSDPRGVFARIPAGIE
jgi:hypothetical protein